MRDGLCRQVKPFNFVLTAAGAKPPGRMLRGRVVPAGGARSSRIPARGSGSSGSTSITPRQGPYRASPLEMGARAWPGSTPSPTCWPSTRPTPSPSRWGRTGQPCGRATVGLLQRRPVTVGKIVLIGKESNRLEERSRGELTVDDLDERITTYEDHDEWYRIVLPRLRTNGVKWVADMAGMSERRARELLAGRARPHRRRAEMLMRFSPDGGGEP